MRLARRVLHALLLVLTLIVGATAAAVIVTQTAWFKNWLRGFIVAQANTYLNGQLSIERLGGNLFFGVELENVGVTLDGSEVVAVEDLGIDYNVFDLVSRGLSIDAIRLNRPILYLRRDGDTWSIARLVKQQAQEADREGPQTPLRVDSIGISDASLIIDDPVGTSGVDVPDRIDRIDAALSFKYEPVRYAIEVSHVSFRGTSPEIGLNALSGGVAVRDDTLFIESLALRTEESSLSVDGAIHHYLTTPQLNLQVTSDKLSLPEIGRIVPSLAGIPLQPAFEFRLNGPFDRLGVDMNVRSSAGQLTGRLVADAQAPGQSVQGDLRVRHLDLAPLLKDPSQTSDLTADVKADLRAESFASLDTLRGTASIRAPRVTAGGYTAERVDADATIHGRRVALDARASAYGASATANGQVTIPAGDDPLAFDLRGHARDLDLRKLPVSLNVPRVQTNVAADYQAAGTIPESAAGRRIDAEATFAASTVPGARIAHGSRVSVSMRGEELAYRADATVRDVNLQTIGEAFSIPALADARYQSTINAHVVADGSGTTPLTMDLRANGEVTESSLLGGRIQQLTFDARVADDTAYLTANGTFADLNPAVSSARPAMEGSLAGALRVDATLRSLSAGVTPDTVAATGTLSLEPSTIGGLMIERATVDADYRDSAGEIRQLELVGRDVNVTASGTLALNETGQSNLTFHADSPRLGEIGRLFDAPLEGIGKVDGTVTGNRTELRAEGTLVGNGLEYQGNGALALSAKYSVRLPELSFDRATVVADTEATFVAVAGQNINELTATTTYDQKTVRFEATAKQPERSLTAGGAVVLHPEHQEIHLTQLGVVAGQQQWSLAPGAEPAVNYAGDTVSVQNFRMVSGAQEIAADGAFGRAGDALEVTLSNIDLAGVDALLLREPQFTGQLNASATVSGTKAAPDVRGEFQVTAGAFRQFRYDTLGGTVAYVPSGVTLDARLQQSATQWIAAKGYVPTAVFSANDADADATLRAGGHVEPATPSERVDLTIDSSPLDLGLIQGFTTAVTDVTGTVEAHVRVTGSAEDPHPEGTVTIADGGMTVAPTGVTYRHIAGQVELQPDRVRVPLITILDNHDSSLSFTGDLGWHGGELGGFQVWMNADDFKIIDNDMGNVRIQSAVSMAGRLRAPIVQGYLGVTTGEINLDEVIALLGSSPYPTEPTRGDAGNTTAALAQVTPAPDSASPFDALRMNVDLSVPDDLRIEAASLQTPGSPVSLGALNLTLGGDLNVTKEPGGPIRLVGVVNTVRGNYDFQGRRFEILRDGAVRFVGLDELNPTLDLRTRRVIQGVEARVNVRGTLQKPEIQLSSTPPLEQADILSLIVFNQPLNQLGEGQQISLAQRAQSLATGAVAGQLAQSIGNALNLDTFEINVAPENGRGPEITLGQQVGQNLYVRVQQGIGDQSSTNFVLEYEIAEWLRLQTNVIQGSSTQQSLFRRNQGSGADLIFLFSY
jgi:autotransporter translocation and assembly factor TamB